MEKRRMEKNNLETSLLGFGCMRFPCNEDGTINIEESEKMLDTAKASGVNYFDTAYPYHDGKSELVVGQIMKKYDRNSFYLATKLPVWLVHSVDDAKRLFQEQLNKLQTDYFDFYLLHAMSKDRYQQMKDLGVVDYVQTLKEEGKIKNYGFSFHDSYEAFEMILNDRDWDFCQIQLNYMDTEEQAGEKGYALAASKKIPVIVMEPVKGGSLAKFSDDVNQMFHDLDPQRSIASFALRWVAAHEGVKVILSGMSDSKQLKDNLETFQNYEPLSETEKIGIDKIVQVIKSRVQNGCTGCRYCMPCPFGVDIPRNFRLWNTYHMYQNYWTVNWEWEKEMTKESKAENCRQCGKCEKNCPQKIEIRKDLKQVQLDLDLAAFK